MKNEMEKSQNKNLNDNMSSFRTLSQESMSRFFLRDQSVRTLDFLTQLGTQYFEEDERLQTWTRWMRSRQWSMERLRRGRPTEDMVTNSANSCSTLREDKALMESARRLVRPDKFRGHPSFWELPLQLSNKVRATFTTGQL